MIEKDTAHPGGASPGSVQRAGSLREAVATMGFEVLPFKGTAEKVLAHVPRDVRLTVTASPPKGIDATIDLTVRLAGEGYTVAPHLSARMIRDDEQLGAIVERLRAAGVDSVFVVGGDADQAGEFHDALSLLHGLGRTGHTFRDVGIGGYPEGHALIVESSLQQALAEKAPLANHIVTQICFDPVLLRSWATQIAGQGITLPIRVGIPGAVSREKLLRITASTGIGESAKFLKKQQNMLWRFFLPGGYSPKKIVNGLRADFGAPQQHIAGFHVFTFNDLEKTEAWRQELLRRLDARR
jgi:methylenetetrahydrofolate reductase (NADPH)